MQQQQQYSSSGSSYDPYYYYRHGNQAYYDPSILNASAESNTPIVTPPVTDPNLTSTSHQDYTSDTKETLVATSLPDEASLKANSPPDDDDDNVQSIKGKEKKEDSPEVKTSSFSKLKRKSETPITVQLKSQSCGGIKKPKIENKSVFGSDSEDEEEMPREAKLRMRNIGKDTPTSAGPNSFKTIKGFSDSVSLQRKEYDWT
jgi:hypothetical protein